MLTRVWFERASLTMEGTAKRAVKSWMMMLPEGVSAAAVPGKTAKSSSAKKPATSFPPVFFHAGTFIRCPDSIHQLTCARNMT